MIRTRGVRNGHVTLQEPPGSKFTSARVLPRFCDPSIVRGMVVYQDPTAAILPTRRQRLRAFSSRRVGDRSRGILPVRGETLGDLVSFTAVEAAEVTRGIGGSARSGEAQTLRRQRDGNQPREKKAFDYRCESGLKTRVTRARDSSAWRERHLPPSIKSRGCSLFYPARILP